MNTFSANIHPEEDPINFHYCEDCPLNNPTLHTCHNNCPLDEPKGKDYENDLEN